MITTTFTRWLHREVRVEQRVTLDLDSALQEQELEAVAECKGDLFERLLASEDWEDTGEAHHHIEYVIHGPELEDDEEVPSC